MNLSDLTDFQVALLLEGVQNTFIEDGEWQVPQKQCETESLVELLNQELESRGKDLSEDVLNILGYHEDFLGY
jgi:hypothetical protein